MRNAELNNQKLSDFQKLKKLNTLDNTFRILT